MNNIRLFQLLFFILSFTFSPIAGYTEEPNQNDILQITEEDVVMGNENAPITMIEYSSLSCPHCAYFQTNVFPKIKENYIDTGKVKFTHRDFPLDGSSLKGAILLKCVPEERYYIFIKVLFEKQSSWAYQKNYLEILENIAKLGGISGEKFQECVNDKELEKKLLEKQLQASKILKINGTPTFFVDNKLFDSAKNYDSFDKLFKEILDKKE